MTNLPNLRELPRILLSVLFIAAAIIASLWVLQPFLPALIWATLIVVATWPLMRAAQKRLWGKRGLAVIVMTTVLLLVVIVPLALAVLTIIEHADDFGDGLKTLARAGVPPPPGWVEGLPLIGPKLAAEWQAIAALGAGELQARIAPYAKGIAAWILGKAGTFAAFFLHLLLTAIISAMFYYNGEAAAAGVRAFARRLAGSRGEQAVTLAGQAIRAVALGVVVTAVVQSLLGGIGLAVAGVPVAGFLTALIFVLAIAQIGPAPVLLLVVAWLYWSGDPVWGTAMLVWTLIVGSLDNILRPLLIKRGADLPLVLIFAGVIGGLLAFGLVGLFVGPVVLAVTYTQLAAWVSEGAREREASSAAS
ncbi:MAG: AI-2E family transporter YdiK [Betaproteobacteria bacterium]|nr:MAG: AI-2E family transporter YdiK [Betaproteobacteria bacterium]